MVLPARERISQVVQRWFLSEPLLFAAWSTHQVGADPRVPTLRVDQGRVSYNPDFITDLSEADLRALLAAEALRILLKHPYGRRKPDSARAWLASNIALAECLRDPRLPFPSAQEVFGSAEFDQKYFEFYYQRLYEAGVEASAAGGGGGSGEPSALDAHAACGENAAGWEDNDLYADRIDARIREADESGRWGNIGGRLRERILATLQPRLDYRDALRRFRASVLCSERVLTRMKPSRRYGFAYMGSRRDLCTRLLVAVDVSGSMGSKDLAMAFSIVNRFFKYGVTAIDVIQFDAEIQGEALSLRKARREVVILGRGGTNFQPVMDYIDEHPTYDGLILFTDGAAPPPTRPRNRRTRLLWLFTNEAMWAKMYGPLRSLGAATYVKGS